MAFESTNATSHPFNSSISPNITDYSVSGDTFGHNTLARIGYFYPLRIAESVIGLIGNLMVIIAVGCYEDLQTATGSLLANLAAADCVLGSLMVLSIVGETMERTSTWLQFCITKEILYIIGGFGNILSLTMVSLDRLVSLSAPFWYQSKMNISKALPCQLIVWIGIILTYSLAFTLRSTATFDIPTCLYVFILSAQDNRLFILYPYYFFTGTTIVNYLILSIMVWRQGQQIAAHNSNMANHVLLRQLKLTKTTTLVLFVYLTLTIPNAIINVLVKKESAASVHLQYVALILWHFNSVINPFIYAYRMPKFRKAFRKMLGLKTSVVAPAPVAGHQAGDM